MRMSHSALVFIAFSLFFCLTAQPAWTAEAADPSKKDTATAKKSSAPAKGKAAPVKKSAQAPVPVAAADPEKLQQDLDVFAKSCVVNMNNQIKPGIRTKQLTKTPEGFQAHYIAVDPDSLSTSFSPSEHKIVPYIGRMMYHEVEYVCMGKTEKEALAGPFNEVNRRPMTELIKYMKGKWTY